MLVFGANNNPTTTKHLSTPRPTPESFEYTTTWFTYDAINVSKGLLLSQH